jgi:hypothetical protein
VCDERLKVVQLQQPLLQRSHHRQAQAQQHRLVIGLRVESRRRAMAVEVKLVASCCDSMHCKRGSHHRQAQMQQHRPMISGAVPMPKWYGLQGLIIIIIMISETKTCIDGCAQANVQT